jgi:hypothetical protein
MSETNENLISLFKSVPVFSGLVQSDLEALEEIFSPLDYDADTLLYQAGQATDGVYLVVSGTLKQTDPTGETPTRQLRRGDVAGYEAFLNIPTRENEVAVVTPSQLLFLENSKVQTYLLPNPDFASTLTVLMESRALAQRVPMPWLQPGEQVHLMTRKHPVFLFWKAFLPIVAFAVPVILSIWFGTGYPLLTSILLMTSFAVCALALGWNIHNWSNDFYLITNKRMVWVERVSGLYDSRQEAPLGTLISVGIKTSRLGALIGYSDVVVRTYIGDIRFERVEHAHQIGKLIEAYWARGKSVDLDVDAKEIRLALRRKFGRNVEDLTPREMSAEAAGMVAAPKVKETNFIEWLFSDFLKVRYEVGGTTTYRRHWFVLIKHAFWPVAILIATILLVVAVVTRNFRNLDAEMTLVLGFFVVVSMFLWLWYVYLDWKNDMFQLTPNQVIDIDRKPLGKESKRSAPLDNILSIEYERKGLLPMIFNYGTVYITIGNTQLTFNDVYNPSTVQQDIFTRMGNHEEEKKQRFTDEERERVAQWFKVYHEVLNAESPTKVLNPPA